MEIRESNLIKILDKDPNYCSEIDLPMIYGRISREKVFR